MTIKGVYTALEDKWYDFWDKVDTKVPVYKIIDPIDSIIPSMVLFILVTILLIAFLIFFSLSSEQVFEAKFTILSPEGTVVEDSLIIAQLLEEEKLIKDLTKRTDSSGQLVYSGVKKGQTINFDINLTKGTYKGTFLVEGNLEETIKLEPRPVSLGSVNKKIFVKNLGGFLAREEIDLEFGCEDSTLKPVPQKATFNGTEIEVIEPVGCKLTATTKSSKYKQKTYLVNSTMFDLFLEPFEEPLSSLKIKIREGGYPVNGTSFKIRLSGQQNYETETGATSEAILNLASGIYNLSVVDTKNIYGIVTKSVTVSGSTEMIIEVTKSIKSKVTISVFDTQNNSVISWAEVSVRDSFGREIANQKTDSSGKAVFTFTDLAEYTFIVKKVAGLEDSFFAKEIKQNLTGDANISIGLQRITNLNAGKTKVKIIDQDGYPVANAKVMLKYKENDSLVELMQQSNYSFSDTNGEAVLIAGKVEGLVYAYAIKGPFIGPSTQKQISFDSENNFDIIMEIGTSTINFMVNDEAGEKVNGTIEIFTIKEDNSTTNISGLISLEDGNAIKRIKAGQVVYARIKAPTYEDYYTFPQMLWPNKAYTIKVTMLKQISEPKIVPLGIFNSEDVPVKTLAPGRKYYAMFRIESDKAYNEVMMHFRVGKETIMDNDILEVSDVEAAGISYEVRGTTYNPREGYAYDSKNTTDGLSKWTNIYWNDFGRSAREIRIWFRVKDTAPQNKELAFMFRGKFDGIKKPESTVVEELYSNTSSLETYYVGAEAVCENGFCSNSEWLYSRKDELYVLEPYEMKQISEYEYHFNLVNNSLIDYGTNKKPISVSIMIVGDSSEEKRIKILGYDIKPPVGRLTNNTAVYKAENLSIASFEKNSTIDTTIKLQAIKVGAELLRIELKSDGQIIYAKEVAIGVVKEKDLNASISPQFVPALLNTEIEVIVFDEKGDYLPNATVRSYAKEVGFAEYLVDTSVTDRLGRAVVNSGAHFQGTRIMIEIIKEGYSIQRYLTQVSSNVVVAQPEMLLVSLNTVSKREEIKEVTLANRSSKNMIIKEISLEAKFKDLINEDALKGHFNELRLEQRVIKAEDTLDIQLLRIRLANSITEENFVEPISVEGKIKIKIQEPNSDLIYDLVMPLRVNVSSNANPGADCLIIKPTSKTSMTTEKAMVRFDFEMINDCASDGARIPLENLSIKSTSEVPGIAEISIRNSTGTTVGITAIDGGKRKIVDKIRPGEKLFGQITFAPGEEAVGKSIQLSVGYEAKFQGQTIRSDPQTVTYTVNVVNLKECIHVESETAPVDFKEKAKIRIDTTACLNQIIDVILCKEDSGCSGGTEGKITLSKKVFSLQNKVEEIEAYNPTYPGTYGVSIYARARGTTGFTYIGEIPVSFYEPESRYFNLNKFELNLVGQGSKDSIVLVNKMLAETINVKANECIWGKKDASFNWSNALAGAMMGAMLGNLIGSAYNPGIKQINQGSKSEGGSDSGLTPQERQSRIDQLNAKLNSEGLTKEEFKLRNDLIKQNQAYQSITYSVYGPSGFVKNLGDSGSQWSDDVLKLNPGKSVTKHINTPGINSRVTLTKVKGLDGADMIALSSPGMKTTYYSASYDGATSAANNYINFQASNSTKFSQTMAKIGGIVTSPFTSTYRGIKNWVTPKPSTTGWVPVTTDSSLYITYPDSSTNLPKGSMSPLEGIKNQSAHFALLNKGGSFNWFQLGLTIVGAVVGGWLMGSQGYKCDEHYAVVGMEDFVILLQGTEVNVVSPDGSQRETQVVPSDAGELEFTLENIDLQWDFTDAQYGSEETVSLLFENNGLNDPNPSYGILTINSTMHEHGKKIHKWDEPRINSLSENDYDVICNKETFGNYWIGPSEKEGSCSGVSKRNYSQKYHIRVISAEPKDQDSYVQKSTSCYLGALTGATGAEALPRVLFDWRWDSIKENTCDYRNEEHVYCDATQFTIALVKKLGALDEFLQQNQRTFTCPPDAIEEEVTESVNEINLKRESVFAGTIGISDMTMDIDRVNDRAKARVKIQNNTGTANTTYVSAAWKGEGEAINDLVQFEAPPGESTIEFEKIVGKSESINYFTAVVNGPFGNRKSVTRAFLNRDRNEDCWIKQTTEPVASIPGLMYFIGANEQTQFTTKIRNINDLYNHINFGVYLTKDAFTEDFFRDFKEYYSNTLFEQGTEYEKRIVNYLTSGNFKIRKKFLGENTFEPGLYDVWVKLNANGNFRVIDGNNTDIVIELLLIKKPSVDSPFYSLPFDGLLGERGGRQGYGTIYLNKSQDNSDVTISNYGTRVYTFYNSASNGVTTLKTSNTKSFESVNSGVSTRGQLAAVSVFGNNGELSLTSNYATPIIAKYELNDTEGNLAFSLENPSKAVITRGNIAYWTGAAKSKDYFGANAVETYNNTPDNRISRLGENVFGFEFKEASRKGNLFLKTIIFIPVERGTYTMKSREENTKIWTPNSDFTETVELAGISGMQFNNKSSYIASLQDLFEGVKQGKICVSNDGSTTSFWWNPKVIETTPGSVTSQLEKELSLIGG